MQIHSGTEYFDSFAIGLHFPTLEQQHYGLINQDTLLSKLISERDDEFSAAFPCGREESWEVGVGLILE